MTPTTCPGFGPHTGTCEAKAGHPRLPDLRRSRIWCERCDRLRMAHLSRCFDELRERLEGRKSP